jgi:hypothetical protein
MNILNSENFGKFTISGTKNNLDIEILGKDNKEIAKFNSNENILNDNNISKAIEKINAQLNQNPTASTNTQSNVVTGGKRSSSKSRKTQLRDEHGRFLPSNKRKMVRRKTARRTMQKSTNPMNTIMTATLV